MKHQFLTALVTSSNVKGKQRTCTINALSSPKILRNVSETELVCLAVEQRHEGKSELAEFIGNRGNRVVDEVLSLTLEFSQAEENVSSSNVARVAGGNGLLLLRDCWYRSECLLHCSKRRSGKIP